LVSKATNPNTQDETGKKIFSIFPYIKETTDRIGRILNKYNIQIVFKSQKKIGQFEES